MSLKSGEKYRCPDPACGSEIAIVRGAAWTRKDADNPLCRCGKPMVRGWARPAWIPSLARGLRLRQR